MTHRIAHINTARCSGCGRCIATCPLRLFAFEPLGWRKVSVLQDREACNGCARCATHCPLEVIDMKKQSSSWRERPLLEA